MGLLLNPSNLFLLSIPVDAIEVSEHLVYKFGTQLISMSLSEVMCKVVGRVRDPIVTCHRLVLILIFWSDADSSLPSLLNLEGFLRRGLLSASFLDAIGPVSTCSRV